jgi:GWxTD domain-containing protein
MMSFDLLVRARFAYAVGWAVFDSLWEGAIVAAVLAVVLGLASSARARYNAACLAMCAIMLCFTVSFFASVSHTQAVQLDRNPFLGVWNPGAGGSPLSIARGRRLADLLPWLAPFWMAGVLLFYLRHFTSWLAARRLLLTGVCCAPEFWQERLRLLVVRLRITRAVLLLESCLAEAPAMMGHLRPVILMPMGLLTGLPIVQIESILLHELAHIRRYDYLVNIIQISVEDLLFYHPLVWWISRVIRSEREHCADCVAAALTGDPREYARALVALEESRWGASEAAVAATGGNLVKRIRRLLVPAEHPSVFSAPVVSAGILLVALAAGLTAWQAKPQENTTNQAQQVSPYTKWLNEDVAYIITDEERAAFKRIQTNEERQQFITQFWMRRNPTPTAPYNPLMREHYTRIGYANLHFATAQGLAGWKTDRGRIYIVFGPPNKRDEHPNGDARPYPWERWEYRWIEGIGNDVSIEFDDPNNSGEYHMTLDPNPSPANLRLFLPPPNQR